MENKMFCYQCQETAKCNGCTMSGVCGKTPDTAVMQDLLVYVSKLLSTVTTQLRKENKVIDKEINHLITLNLFTTITNANFDKKVIEERVTETLKVKEELLSKVKDKNSLSEKVFWNGNKDEYENKGKTVGVLSTKNEDVRSLRELITYGLKGLSAYSKHANVLMSDNEEVDAFLQSALAKTLDDSLSVEELINLTLETGKYGVEGMAMLDKAKQSDLGSLTEMCKDIMSQISTNFTAAEIVQYATAVTKYQMKETTGFPFELTTMNLSTTGDTVIPIDLAQNVSELHQFLFNETDYQPTDTVQTVSDKIAKKTGVTSKTSAFDLTQYNDTVGSDGTEGAKKKNKDKQDALKKSQSESENDSTTKSSSDDSDE